MTGSRETGSRRRLAVAVLAIASLVVSGALLWRNRPPKGFTPEAVKQARAAARVFDSLPAVSIEDRSAVASAILSASPLPDQAGTEKPGPEVERYHAEFLAEWLDLRRRGDAAAYIAWVRGRGYLPTLERPDGKRFMGMRDDDQEAWRQAYARELPAGRPVPAEEWFRICFQGSLKAQAGVMRSERVALGEGLRVTFLRLDIRTQANPDYPSPFPLTPWKGVELWTGFATVGDAVHWAAPISLAEVLRRDGTALVAIAMMALRSSEGEWLPTTTASYFDPASSEWHFDQVSLSNTLHLNHAFHR